MKKIILGLLLTLIFSTSCFAFEKAFYILRSNSPGRLDSVQKALDSLKQHTKSIDILISQAYQIDENGAVSGFVDPMVLDLSNKKAIKLMLLLTNIYFDKEAVHKFLNNPSAQERALQSIIAACDQQHVYGVQLDFEMVALNDRDALTKFYKNVATALHSKGYQVSVATAPVVEDKLFTSDFEKRVYQNWEGAYDLKEIAKFADFVSVMAYNQHGGGTTPGPTASYPWIEKIIQYTLQYVPAEKVSLALPSYSTYWYTASNGESINSRITQHDTGISYAKAMYILQKNHASLQWNDIDKMNVAIYEKNWLDEYLFIENAKSFSAKVALAKKYHLRGISVFDLGSEDPQLWSVL